MDAPLRRDDVLVRAIGGELVVLDRRREQVHQLNATAQLVWDSCDGATTVPEMVARLRAAFPDAPLDVEADVRSILAEFRRRGLLQAG